jgi:GLPGLI family protein
MKKIVSSFFLLFIFIANGQFVSHYKIIPIEDEKSEIYKMLRQMNPNFDETFGKIDYTLTITNGKTFFEIIKKSIPDDQAVKMFIALLGDTGLIVQKNDSIYKQSNFDNYGKKFIVTDTIQSNWKLLNETKNIMGYTCYKAETIDVVVNPVGTFKNPVYAWYCPQFPYHYGPAGYGKLPGLIFELQTKRVLYGITSIDMSPKDIEIPEFDKKSEIISTKDLNDLIQKLHQQRFDMMKEEEEK